MLQNILNVALVVFGWVAFVAGSLVKTVSPLWALALLAIARDLP